MALVETVRNCSCPAQVTVTWDNAFPNLQNLRAPLMPEVDRAGLAWWHDIHDAHGAAPAPVPEVLGIPVPIISIQIG